jgi:hypothetical protein
VKIVVSFILLALLGVNDTHAFQAEKIQPDTIDRTKVQFSFSDSVLMHQFKLATVDSFSRHHYSQLKGITTFRGGIFRNGASYGHIQKRPSTLSIKWKIKTASYGKWGGGSGWTGQPSIVQWPKELLQKMNLASHNSANDSLFTEVIAASLNGNIYFLDLATGQFSRKPININNPIKGSVTVDPRGLPILYVGQGVANKKEFGFRLFSLIDSKRLFFLDGKDRFAVRNWAAFDGAPLINPKNDMMYLGGENGLFYFVKLNTHVDSLTLATAVAPQVLKLKYHVNAEHKVGIENSVAAFQDKIFFADNHGYIIAFDLISMTPMWVSNNHDDTDATLVIQPEGNIPYLYTGNEVDKQGKNGFVYLKKMNGFTGQVVWEKKYPCFTLLGDHPVNGGMLSTPILGKQKASGKVIFSLSRYNAMNKGLLVALNQATGDVIYETVLPHYAWSSPLDIYDKEGNMYIFLADSGGNVMLIDGEEGTIMVQKKIADLFEASPVAYNNLIVIPSRPNFIFCLELE